MKYSKGPWIYNTQPVASLGFYIQSDPFDSRKKQYIGEVGGGQMKDEEVEANAKLISTAPEMIEVLQELVKEVMYNDLPWQIKEKIEQVISKATL